MEKIDTTPTPVVFTNKARCRDCYRCVRVCPVKAIRMQDGQAAVDEERCIACGTCIRECPQGAKAFRNDLERAIEIVATGGRVAASIAPSFAGVFQDWERRRIASALRRMGFSYAAETSVGAWHVARATSEAAARRPGHTHIASSCPAVVRYIERYRPQRTGDLVPVVSPMIAHARLIRERMGKNTRVVFIGPCTAKKAEADRPELAGEIDCVLTFTELREWFERENIDLARCEESAFDEVPVGEARLFPVAGGALRTAAVTPDLVAPDVLSLTGHDEIRDALEMPAQGADLVLEALFCPHGCINGPCAAAPEGSNVYDRRRNVLDYARHADRANTADAPPTPDLAATFHADAAPDDATIDEEAIRAVFERTGKTDPDNQLNCGACGYDSCHDNAVAVIRGLAEAEMCIPYMRKLAEQRADRIFNTSPNGIVILDEHLTILNANPAFRRMFTCSQAVAGKPISYLIDPAPFEKLAAGETDRVEQTVDYTHYHLACHQIAYRLPEERQFVGIFVNVTETRRQRESLDRLRAETVLQAQELMEHQMRMSQEIVNFLGENTARSEELVERLVDLTDRAEPTKSR